MASLRQIAKELGVSHTLLVLWQQGKRKLEPELEARYHRLVTSGYKSSYREAMDLSENSQNLYLKSGAEGGSRTHIPVRVADFKSAASTISPPRPWPRQSKGLHGLDGRSRRLSRVRAPVYYRVHSNWYGRVADGGDGRIRLEAHFVAKSSLF